MRIKRRQVISPKGRNACRLLIVLIVIALLLIGVFLNARQPAPAAIAYGDAGYTYAPVQAVKRSGALNLNTATLAELEALPRIGEKTALLILAAREAAGGFRYPEELLSVPGIGAKTLAAILPLICLSDD